MNRKTKLFYNSISSIGYQFTAIICGFILPRFFLLYYGSETNGLVSSITQFLGFITLAECGVGAVVQSTLYKPLAEKDMVSVSKIFQSSNRFFKRIAYILLVYVVILMVTYPIITIDSFDYLFTLSLIFVISISTFAQYYIGMPYKLLLDADQLGFFQYIIHTAALLLNTVTSILLMRCGASVHIVKLISSLIFILQPVALSIIAKRRYEIDYKIVLTEEPITQKWNGLAQHIAGVILINTDTVVLTLFSTLEDVSIYAVYHLFVNGIRQIVLSMTNGVRAMFGNMLAKDESEELNHSFDQMEWLFHTIVTFIFSVTAVLIVPFVQVYTVGITDADYIIPVFAYLITLAQATYCYRLPYYILVNAAGHYKQTQWSAITEAAINVILSVVLVFHFGLIGVAIGTIAAMIYRTIYLAWYLSRNIIFREIRHFIKHIAVDTLSAGFIFLIVYRFTTFFTLQEINYFAWFILAVKVGVVGLGTIISVNLIVYPSKTKHIVSDGKKKK